MNELYQSFRIFGLKKLTFKFNYKVGPTTPFHFISSKKMRETIKSAKVLLSFSNEWANHLPRSIQKIYFEAILNHLIDFSERVEAFEVQLFTLEFLATSQGHKRLKYDRELHEEYDQILDEFEAIINWLQAVAHFATTKHSRFKTQVHSVHFSDTFLKIRRFLEPKPLSFLKFLLEFKANLFKPLPENLALSRRIPTAKPNSPAL